MERDDAEAITAFLRRHRWVSLATVADDGSPLASQVAVVPDDRGPALLMHLSRLAEHTRNLARRPVASVVFSAADTGGIDPQILPRVSLSGPVDLLARDAPAFAAARARYLGQLPSAAPRFEFTDFELFALRPERGQYVGGFARAVTLGPPELARIFTDLPG